MQTRWVTSRTVFLTIMLMAAFLGAAVPQAHAWNMSVNPMSRSTVPGGTVTYTVSVFYDTPTDALFPSVELLVSPPEPHVSVTFTYDNPDPHPPPYTATMTVHVDNAKPPGTYTLYLWANPSGTPFPGPGNREIDLRLVVAGGAGGQVHLNVPHSPLSVNQPVYIEYYTDPGADGAITLMITRPPLLAIFWTKGPEPITGGLLYDVTAPGFDTPGTYHVGATVELSGGGSINGETTFQVGTGGVFGFTIVLSPSRVEVNQGETAHYRILLTYSDPSYSGTDITIQMSGLGPGMDWHLTEAGDLTVKTSPTTATGTYTITAIGSAMGVTRQASATLVVTSGQPPSLEIIVDWTVLSIAVSPATPKVGDAVTLSMDMTALSSSMPFPQDVVVECQIDPPASSGGTECFFGTVAFPGPTGKSFTVTSKMPWAATPGTHTLMWDIATTGDPNPGNNAKTISFTVVEKEFEFRIDVTPVSQTVSQGETASYSISVVGVDGFNSAVSLAVSGLPSGTNAVLSIPSGTPNFSSTLTVAVPRYAPTGSFALTITGTGGDLTKIASVVLIVNPAKTTLPPPTQTTTTAPPLGPGFPDLTWIIIGILAVLIVIFAAFALRRRQPAYQPAPPAQATPTPPAVAEKPGPLPLYCVHCGTENPSTNEFCGKCGKELLRPKL